MTEKVLSAINFNGVIKAEVSLINTELISRMTADHLFVHSATDLTNYISRARAHALFYQPSKSNLTNTDTLEVVARE